LKLYTISRLSGGTLQLLCEAQTKNGVVRESRVGSFDIGNSSEGTKALALAIMNHYYGAGPSDPGATAEAQRKAGPFLEAFLAHQQMPLGAKLEISSDVIDRFFSLNQPA